MTREEAIIVLKYGMKYRNPKNDTEKDRNEALDMAISALSENKGDLISRQAVLNQIFYSTDNSGDVALGSALRHRIENLPSVENKGEWKEEFKGGRKLCSNCGIFNFSKYKNFCPNCGADMRGE